jgi:iron complex transport system ATP-binding protein
MLHAKNIHFSLDQQAILADVSLSLQAGEFIGLIGPNGAGKTSLLRVLAGLSAPDSGQVVVDGAHGQAPLMALAPPMRARLLAFLAQQEKPAWPLAVKHLVGLGRAPWRRPLEQHHDDEQAITNALALTELTHLAERSVSTLSGGELQRTLLARVFAGEPQIIIADEPIAALDPYHQLHMMELLRDHAQRGGAVIAALHDLSLAARYCQRLILLDRGRVCAFGEPVRVLTPENLQQVYGISAHVDCREDGVVIIPRARIN